SYLPFVLLHPPPPQPTLFPYTTLFRSKTEAAFCWCNRTSDTRIESPHEPGARLNAEFVRSTVPLIQAEAGHGVPCPYGKKNDPADRKSTRLNSSHVSISYAVFCLKKKK